MAHAFTELPGWHDDAHAAAVPAFRRSCARLLRRPAEQRIGPQDHGGHAADWHAACHALAMVADGDDEAARRYFETWFTPYRLYDGGRGSGLVTGYFEPQLRGARAPDERYTVPLYGRPDDLVTVELGDFRPALKGERIAGRLAGGRLVPYAPRAEIEDGALSGRGLELVWVDDPVDAFFLHIQGSGRVALPDGEHLRIGYAATNGHVYYAIGRALIEAGAIPREAMSMQAIRAWLAANPEEGRALMRQNPSFVFFRELSGEGPIGAEGVPLTAGRSLAIDTGLHPLGVPVWLDTSDPLEPARPLQRLTIAQDTGGAIRGPVRADLFFGHGPAATERAGHMQQDGALYLLLPRTAAPGS